MRWLRLSLFAMLGLAGLLVLLLILLFTVDLGFLKPQIEKIVERVSGRTLEIDGELDIELGSTTRLMLENGRFGNPEWSTDPNMVEARRIEVLFDLRSVFDKAAAFMATGARGLVYGRNIYQHDNPRAVVSALMAMIHNGASGEEAWEIYCDA